MEFSDTRLLILPASGLTSFQERCSMTDSWPDLWFSLGLYVNSTAERQAICNWERYACYLGPICAIRVWLPGCSWGEMSAIWHLQTAGPRWLFLYGFSIFEKSDFRRTPCGVLWVWSTTASRSWGCVSQSRLDDSRAISGPASIELLGTTGISTRISILGSFWIFCIAKLNKIFKIFIAIFLIFVFAVW